MDSFLFGAGLLGALGLAIYGRRLIVRRRRRQVAVLESLVGADVTIWVSDHGRIERFQRLECRVLNLETGRRSVEVAIFREDPPLGGRWAFGETRRYEPPLHRQIFVDSVRAILASGGRTHRWNFPATIPLS